MDLRSTFLKFLLSHYYSSWLLTMQKTTRILRRCVARWASVYIHLHTNLLINKIFNTFLFYWVVDESDALVPQIVLCHTHHPSSLLGLWIESPGLLCSSLHFWWLKQVKWTDYSLLWFIINMKLELLTLWVLTSVFSNLFLRQKFLWPEKQPCHSGSAATKKQACAYCYRQESWSRKNTA